VFEEATGAEYRFVLPGPRVSEREWRNCLGILEQLHSRPKFMVASGSLPPDVPQDFYARVARIARKLGAKFVLDTSGAALEAALKEGVYLLKPNLRELNEFLGAEAADDGAIIEASRRIIARYRVEVVVTSLGEDGAILVSADKTWRAEAPRVHVLSAVGAGDSFLGAMVSWIATGHALEDAFDTPSQPRCRRSHAGHRALRPGGRRAAASAGSHPKFGNAQAGGGPRPLN